MSSYVFYLRVESCIIYTIHISVLFIWYAYLAATLISHLIMHSICRYKTIDYHCICYSHSVSTPAVFISVNWDYCRKKNSIVMCRVRKDA